MAQLLKLRPVLKNEQELEEERNLIFDLPRKNTAQMSPEIHRLFQSGKKSEIVHRWHILKRILKRARYKKVDDTVLPFLEELDKSDSVIMDGEVSKRIYNEIFHSRNIDLYGNLRTIVKHPPRKYLELKALAEAKGVEFTQELDESKLPVEVKTDEEEEALKEKMKIPKLTTEKWKIGRVEISYAPVGFANNPSQPFHSLGNELYFSYDGTWKNGKMEGYGTYLFRDRSTYEGEFHENRPHGFGKSIFKQGQRYEGDYVKSQFEGQGKYRGKEGIQYVGTFFDGKRSGKGKLTFPSGLTYEGDFLDGKPHGRGTMSSKLTGWAWEGSFVKGGISGHGQIIKPPPERTRIIYYWSEKKDPISLPNLILHYLKEQEDARLHAERLKNEVHAPLRGLLLRDYVNAIRTSIHEERKQEKRNKINEQLQKIREQKAKLQEARLKALAGEK